MSAFTDIHHVKCKLFYSMISYSDFPAHEYKEEEEEEELLFVPKP